MILYAEMATATNFSFLRGASHPHELVAQAMALGHTGIGIADRNTVSGVVRAYAAMKTAQEKLREKKGPDAKLDFKLAVGARGSGTKNKAGATRIAENTPIRSRMAYLSSPRFVRMLTTAWTAAETRIRARAVIVS